ncbi:NUDIX domain-containing protein [Conexibacter sp. SYSU D00693]|uniref:NUDIX domain-containing protein n=1 Tax=Conexibacter sp. SYSU D00693 TaxID=2812560 RepID=UPI00196A6808|nr:NUDIX hydrolase [Conexibacter sp. SYSU D00693]
MSDRDFTALGGDTIHEGKIFTVRSERFRFADGDEVTREVVRHGGAVGMVAVDDEDQVVLVLQPREAVGDPDSLELPAGRLDKEGEEPLETAKRELAEEVGLQAERWEHLTTYRSSVGFTDEVVHLYLAEGLSEAPPADSGEDERIEVVRRPLAEMDRLVEEITDSKTLLGLLLLERRRRQRG